MFWLRPTAEAYKQMERQLESRSTSYLTSKRLYTIAWFRFPRGSSEVCRWCRICSIIEENFILSVLWALKSKPRICLFVVEIHTKCYRVFCNRREIWPDSENTTAFLWHFVFRFRCHHTTPVSNTVLFFCVSSFAQWYGIDVHVHAFLISVWHPSRCASLIRIVYLPTINTGWWFQRDNPSHAAHLSVILIGFGKFFSVTSIPFVVYRAFCLSESPCLPEVTCGGVSVLNTTRSR